MVMAQLQVILKSLKDVGIDAKPNQQEYGAYISTTFYGKYESMAFGPQTPFLDPDNFLYGPHIANELKNQGHVDDPIVTDLLVRQRRTMDAGKRREVLHEIQRHLAKQQWYVYLPSGVYIGVWDGALKNYAPNLGYDWGGRATAGWPHPHPPSRRTTPLHPPSSLPPPDLLTLDAPPPPARSPPA